MSWPADIGQRPLAVDEAYAALETYAREYGREPLLLLMHAAVAETLRADLLALIRLNFMPGHADDMSLDADVLFAPLTTELGGGYFRIDPQVRWHCLALLRSLHRDEPRLRQRRVAELLWRYAEGMEQQATRAADPLLAEFLDIQRWVALAFLEPAGAAHAFAQALRLGSEAAPGTAARLRLGGLASAIELPLAGEHELLSYARGLDALARGDDEQAERILGRMGDADLRVGGVALTAPTALLRQLRPATAPVEGAAQAAEAASPERKVCLFIGAFGQASDLSSGRAFDADASFAMLRAAAERAGMACVRNEDVAPTVGAGNAPYQAIIHADRVVCDLSLASPEVLLLLGIAMALREYRVSLICQAGSASWPEYGLQTFAYPPHGSADAEAAWRAFGDRLASDEAAKPSLASPVTWQPPVPVADPGPDAEDPSSPGAASNDICLVLHGLAARSDVSKRPTADPEASVQLIRDVVAPARLTCVAVDPGEGAGPFDAALARQLVTARLVVADVSASPPDTLLAIGLRFAWRPAGTLLLADERWAAPLLLASTRIVRYRRAEGRPGVPDAASLRGGLSEGIAAALASDAVDSPVYRALPHLLPPHAKPVAPTPAAAPPRPKVFISYVHEYRDLVRPLIAALDGVAVTWDMDLKPGDAWDTSLRAMLEAADAVIAVAGRVTRGRPFPIAEIGRALTLGKRLIPVFIDPFSEPVELRRLQCANTDRDGKIAYLGTLHGKALDEAIHLTAANIMAALAQAPPSPRAGPSLREMAIARHSDGALEFAFEEGTSHRLRVRYQPSLVNPLLQPLTADTQLPTTALGALAQLLLPRELADLPSPERWRLNLSRDVSAWPWELLLSHHTRSPLAPASVFRRLTGLPTRTPLRSARRRALIVSNPQTQGTVPDAPQGLVPLPAATDEGAAVATCLRGAGYEVAVSDAEDARAVLSLLFADEYQLILLTGHGVRDLRLAGGRSITGFLLSDGAVLSGAEIAQMRVMPDLVFMNGDHAGLVNEGQGNADAPPGDPLVPELLQAGVRCVVAPAWAVDDAVAALFSQRCFDALCQGRSFEAACAEARQAAFDAAPTLNTWAAYQAWGDPDFSLAAPAAA